jgi:hypothetical protein
MTRVGIGLIMPAVRLGLILTFLACALEVLPLRAADQNAAPSAGGGLEGKIELQKRDGEPILPQGAKVWIFYGPSTGCAGQVRSPIECPTELPADRFLDAEFACEGKFAKPIEQVRDGLSRLKSPQDDSEQQRREKLSAQLNGYYTRCGDVAVAKTMAWAQKHPRENWQIRLVASDSDGRWSATGLHPGHYILVMRATFGDIDAYSLDTDPPRVAPGQTQTAPQLNPLLSERAALP